MKTAKDSNLTRIQNVSPQLEQTVIVEEEEIQPWEQIDEELWLPHRVRGSWRGGVLG
jgi:hypothetical protein